MNTCPKCGQRASIVRLLLMTRRRPYQCGSCGAKSFLLPRHNTVAALMTICVVLICALLVAPRIGVGLAVAAFVLLYLLLGPIMLFFMKLRLVNP